MPAGQELTQPMFIQSTNQTADAQVTQVSTDWAQPEPFSPHTQHAYQPMWRRQIATDFDNKQILSTAHVDEWHAML